MCFDISVSGRVGERTLDVSFRSDARITGIVGPSGCGKTSLLNMVAGLLTPDSGHVSVGGELLFDAGSGLNMPTAERRAGYVFQDRRLFPHMRVRDNLLYGAAYRDGVSGSSFSLEMVIEFLDIGRLLDRWPGTLSGGEAQRVAIGRALLSRPRFLLLDEPLGALDGARREEIMSVIERIGRESGLPILYVSHDDREVARLCGNIISL